MLRVRAEVKRCVRHTDIGRQEDFGVSLVQEAQAIGKINNNANRKEDARFLPTLKGLGFLAHYIMAKTDGKCKERIDSGIAVRRARSGGGDELRPVQGYRVRSHLVHGRVRTEYKKV